MCVGSVPVSRTFTASDRRGPGTAWTCETGVTCRVEREFSRLPRMTRQLRLEILMRGCLSGVIPRAGRHWPGSGGRGIGRSRAETAPARASQRGRAARSGLAAGGRARTCPPWAADLSARWPVRAAPQPPTAQQAGPRRPGRKGRCGAAAQCAGRASPRRLGGGCCGRQRRGVPDAAFLQSWVARYRPRASASPPSAAWSAAVAWAAAATQKPAGGIWSFRCGRPQPDTGPVTLAA